MSDFLAKAIASFSQDSSMIPVTIAVASSVAVLIYCLLRTPKNKPTRLDVDCQTTVLPGPERIRMCAICPYLPAEDDIVEKTVPEVFERGLKISGDDDCLGWRPSENEGYRWMSYREVHDRAYAVGSALKELGYEKQSFIGICASNKPEWMIVDQGTAMFSMVLVPLYETLGADGMLHIFKQTEMSVMFCDTKNASTLIDRASTLDQLKIVVTFGNVDDEDLVNKCKAAGIRLMSFHEIEELGRKHQHPKELPQPDDLHTICYTSGTTGNPKGVMLSHMNIASLFPSLNYRLKDDGFVTKPDDILMSYLPLSHMYERFIEYNMLHSGARIGYFRGNVKEIVKDLQALRPTYFAAVPRVLNSLYDKIHTGVAGSWFKSFLFHLALNRKMALLDRGIIRNDSIWDLLVFRKIQNIVGGRVRVISSASAPLSGEVLKFMRAVMGCLVFEAYGQTETTVLSTLGSSYDNTFGHVGSVIPNMRVKLVDVPEMDYLAENDQGEVWVQGKSTMIGYYKEPEKTAETLIDGWVASGDIGQWLPNGTLKLIDRRKHLFKLCQGEYVAPEKVEVIYGKSMFVSQVFVTGNSLESCTVGIVMPNEEYLMIWAKKKNISGSFKELCSNEEVKKYILKDITNQGNSAGLCSFEQVKAIHLHPDAMTTENGLLTPTMKVKRSAVSKLFAEEITSMYAKLKQEKPSKKSLF